MHSSTSVLVISFFYPIKKLITGSCFRILATVPMAGTLSSDQLLKLTYGPYLPTKLSSQAKPTQKQDENDVHSGPLYRLLLDLRNEIAQVGL